MGVFRNARIDIFRNLKTAINFCGTETGTYLVRVFGYMFSDVVLGKVSTRKWRYFLIYVCVQKWRLNSDRDGFPQIVGGNKRYNKLKTGAAQAASIFHSSNVSVSVCPRQSTALFDRRN